MRSNILVSKIAVYTIYIKQLALGVGEVHFGKMTAMTRGTIGGSASLNYYVESVEFDS